MIAATKKVTSGTPSEPGSELFSKALLGMVEAQKEALGKIPLEHAGVMQIAFMVAMFALPVAFLLIFKDHEKIGAVFAAGGLVALLVGMFFLRPSFSKAQTGTGKLSAGPMRRTHP